MVDNAPPSHRLRVAVIGGGVTGLAAAHRILRLLPRVDLRLFEAHDRLGGPLLTLRTGDSILEQGADSFIITKPSALELCRELGLADQLTPTNEHHRRALVVRDGKLLPVPDGFVLMRPHNLKAMWRTPVLSMRGKLRLFAEPLIRRPAAVLEPDYDESVASFAMRRLGREVYERLVQPLVAGIFVADAHRLSLAATYPEFLQAEREYGSLQRALQMGKQTPGHADRSAAEPAAARYGQFVTLRSGMHSLIEALADELPRDSVHLSTRVNKVARSSENLWTVTAKDGLPESFDGVIIASPAPQTSRLLAECDAELSRDLTRIEYASSAVVTLVYKRDQIAHPLNGFGAVVPAIENRPIIAASFLTVKFPKHAPSDRHVIRIFLGGALNPDVVERADAELIAIAQRELQSLVDARGGALETHVARWRNSMPQYYVGHLKLVEAIERRAAAHPGLQLAGSAYRGVGIPQCVHSGRAAAERLAAELAGRPGSRL